MTDKAISPLRQRMIEDMTIRKFAPKTQHAPCAQHHRHGAGIRKPSQKRSFRLSRLRQRTRVHSGNPALRRPSISSFAFDCPPRAVRSEIVNAGSVSSRHAAASRASASRPRWAKADARHR